MYAIEKKFQSMLILHLQIIKLNYLMIFKYLKLK